MIELELTGILLCSVAILFLLVKTIVRLLISSLFNNPFEITRWDQVAFIFVMILSLVPVINFFIAYMIFKYALSTKVINRKLWRKVN